MDQATPTTSQAVTVYTTLKIHIWIKSSMDSDTLLTVKLYRDTHLTYDTHKILTNYLTTHPLITIHLYYFQWLWLGPTLQVALHLLEPDLEALIAHPPPEELSPKQAMWDKI